MIASREFIVKKLAELITEPKKRYSQNFLTDHFTVSKAVDALLESECDEVIEIGPGLGALSEDVLNRNKKLTAFEIDVVMVGHLKEYFKKRSIFEVVEGDFLKADLSRFKNKKIGVISNLPYNLTTPLIEKVLLEEINLTNFVFMVQKEVSSRIFAKINTKEYSPLSIMFDYLGNVSTVIKVRKDKFIPAPNVDSIILKLEVTKPRDFKFEKKFFKFLNSCFAMRRKTLLNNLTSIIGNKEKCVYLLNKFNISNTIRPEQVSLEQYLLLCNELYKNGEE